MKCPFCKKGTMKKITDVMEEDHVEFECYECPLCGEGILDSGQMLALAKKYRKLKKAREVTFAQWGNSIALRIPYEIAKEYNIKPGRKAQLTKEKGLLTIIPA